MATLRSFLKLQKFERIPLKKLKTGHYKFCVTINNVKGEFILDTGASTSCIGLEGISFFKLISEESDVKAAGAGAIDMKTQATKNNKVVIGSIVLKNVQFVLFDLVHVNQALQQEEESPIHGIIGAEILKKLHAIIDYGKNCVYLKK